MRDRKLVGSRQRSLSSRFSLSRRARPLLAGNVHTSICKEKTSGIGKRGKALNLPTFNVENLTPFFVKEKLN